MRPFWLVLKTSNGFLSIKGSFYFVVEKVKPTYGQAFVVMVRVRASSRGEGMYYIYESPDR